MKKQLIADIGQNESRVALLEDGELEEIYIERPGIDRLVGNIYRGRVCSVLPGMQAAFVDIGYEKNAFLYAGDIVEVKEYGEDDDDHTHDAKNLDIAGLVKVGQELTVQVIKEPMGSKGRGSPRTSRCPEDTWCCCLAPITQECPGG